MSYVFDFEHCLAYVIAALLIAVFVLIFYNRLFVYREQEMNTQNMSRNSRLALVLKSGKLRLWIYELASRHYITLSETGEYTDEYNPIDFSQFYDRDDFEALRRAVFDISEGRRLTSNVTMRSTLQSDGRQHVYEVNVSIANRDRFGRVTRILGIQHDVTDSLEKKQKVSQLLMRYHTVFNSSLSDMIYYDKDGVLSDINDKACEAFNVGNREHVLKSRYKLEDNPFFNALNFSGLENTRTTSIVDFDQFRDARYRLDEFRLSGRIYYESTVNPIFSSDNEFEGIYISGRNVTEMVESFHRQQEGAIRLRKATRNIQRYIDNINYALRVSNVLFVNYYPHSYSLEMSVHVNKTQMRLSQLRCIRLATPRFRRAVSSVLNRMDHLTPHNIEQTIETEIRDSRGRQIWLMFSMVPMRGADGRVERYFGMCCDVTEMVETERRLAIETKKAQETELLKQSFLTNMSYEIRTPLNTVVGFAELFEGDHDVADEPVFVEEIKKNSNSLLQLINDILFLSRLDANMIEFSKADVDFAQIFESHCQMGWSSMGPDVKAVVENTYEHLVVTIDQANVGKVIEMLALNAARFTKKGSVHAKYEYRHGELAFSIEDTGAGIDPQTLPHVFDRFVRNRSEELCGTGLDLPIVQSLVQQMGGTVEFQSEQGKGTTVWVFIPCEAKTIEKKREIIV